MAEHQSSFVRILTFCQLWLVSDHSRPACRRRRNAMFRIIFVLTFLIASCAEEKKPAPPLAVEYATATVVTAVPAPGLNTAVAPAPAPVEEVTIPKPEPKYPSAGAPKFVLACVEIFKGESDARFAYSRLFGWGRGKLKRGESFIWCAYSNSDAYVQLNVDVRLSESQMGEIRTHKDKEDRSWEASTDKTATGEMDGTWIGWTNDPALGSGDDPLVKSWEGDGELVTNMMIEAMKSLSFIKSMTVAELLY